MPNFIFKSFIAYDEPNRPNQIKTALSHAGKPARRHEVHRFIFKSTDIASILLKRTEAKVIKSAPSSVMRAKKSPSDPLIARPNKKMHSRSMGQLTSATAFFRNVAGGLDLVNIFNSFRNDYLGWIFCPAALQRCDFA